MGQIVLNKPNLHAELEWLIYLHLLLFSIFCNQKLVRYSVLCVQVVSMETLNKQLLITLLDFAQCDVPANVQVLARELCATRAEVAKGLNELARLGLVRPETIRLTFVGLMHATGLRASMQQSATVAA